MREPAAGPHALWRVEAYPAAPVLDAGLEIRLALLAAGAGGRLIRVAEERLSERDWLAENRRAFPPLRIGRFFVHGSHWTGAAPPGAIPLEIDAATAFGTGEHPSTRGVLLALDRLARHRRFRRPLDIGTGTGVLAIAAAKLLHRNVLASDIDCAAARVAAHHVRRNGLRGHVRVICAPGYRARAVRRTQYDLILANILARPLSLMARDLARALAPGGVAILAGLLRRQERMVLAAHRMQGLGNDGPARDRRLVDPDPAPRPRSGSGMTGWPWLEAGAIPGTAGLRCPGMPRLSKGFCGARPILPLIPPNLPSIIRVSGEALRGSGYRNSGLAIQFPRVFLLQIRC